MRGSVVKGAEGWICNKVFLSICVNIGILQEEISGRGSLPLAPPWHEQLGLKETVSIWQGGGREGGS